MKTNNDIEAILKDAKRMSLTGDEKTIMKSELLLHASQSLRHERPSVRSPFSIWIMRGAVSLASVCFVLVGTAYASQNSLPGEPLYAMKVHVYEEMVALTKTTPEDRISYDLTLMETRLSELKLLAAHEETLPTEDLSLITEQISEHVADTHEMLADTEHEAVPHTEKIETLVQLRSIAEAQETVAEQTNLSSIAEEISTAGEAVDEVLSQTIDTFIAEETTETVQEYISEQVSVVGEVLPIEGSDPISDTTEKHLNDVNESLIVGDTEEALRSILEAQQQIGTEQYLETTDTEVSNEIHNPSSSETEVETP